MLLYAPVNGRCQVGQRGCNTNITTKRTLFELDGRVLRLGVDTEVDQDAVREVLSPPHRLDKGRHALHRHVEHVRLARPPLWQPEVVVAYGRHNVLRGVPCDASEHAETSQHHSRHRSSVG